MAKHLLTNFRTNRTVYWLLPIALFSFFISLSSFTDGENDPRKSERRQPVNTVLPLHKARTRPFDADPIKFILQANKQTAAVGEEITITITAHYLNIPSALLFTAAGSTAFRLKMLLPDGFVQTGGDYTDYVGTELSATKPTATYTLKGHFDKAVSKADFRLLRSHAQADANSLFVEKARATIGMNTADLLTQQPRTGAREGSCGYAEGQPLFTTSWGEAMFAHYYNGVLYAAYQDGTNFRPQHWLVATGQMTPAVASCFAENDPHTSAPNPTPTSGSNNGTGLLGTYYNNTNLSGSPVKQQVDGTINFSWGDQGPSPASGVNATNMSARWSGQVEAPVTGTYTFKTLNDDATRLTVNGQPLINDWPGGHAPAWFSGSINLTAGQKYSITLDFNQGAGGAQAQLHWEYPGQGSQIIPQSRLYPDAATTTPTNNPTPTNGCVYSEGQPLFTTSWGEAMFAHYYNGVLFAAYQDGSNFKSKSWLIATGQMTPAVASCFADNDPRTSTQNPTTNPNPTSGCGTGSGLTGFYTNSSDLSQNLVAIRTDAQINFPWGNDSPMPGIVNADGFSIRWFGQVEAPASGNYTFKSNNDDGTRVWINGQLLIDDWNGHGPTWQQGGIYLTAGQKYDIVIDFADFGGGAQAQLYWEYPGQGLQIVPSCRLYPIPTSGQFDSNVGNVLDYQLDGLTIRTDLTGKVYGSNLRSWPWPKNPTKCPNLSPKIPKTPKKSKNEGGAEPEEQDDCGGGGGGGPIIIHILSPPGTISDPVTQDPISGGGPGNPTTGTPTLSGTRVPTTAYLDVVDCDKITGWAFANTGGYAYLDIYVDDVYGRWYKAATIKADNATRPDVRAAFGNNPNIPLNCGFVWAIPDGYKHNQKLNINVVPVNDVASISNSPLRTSGDCSKPGVVQPTGVKPLSWKDFPLLNSNYQLLMNFYSEMAGRGISFTDEEKEVIAQVPALINSIRAYVDQHGQKPDFIVLMDKYLEDTYAFVTSPEERAILANRSVQDQFAFRSNAINASLKSAIIFMAADCQNNECNAYRHAYFNALNAQSFTVPVARQLGQAREGNRRIDPNTLLPTNFVCDPNDPQMPAQYMDLFNNEWGYRAFNQFQAQGGNLADTVQAMVVNGSLRNAPGCP